jgi:SAM-dependent methyltransferase
LDYQPEQSEETAMPAPPLMKVYDPRGEEYLAAFKEFLDHTDQKTKAMAWLEREVDALPAKRVFIDAGAGNGKLTAWFVPRFGQVIAIEPNPTLAHELRAACPTATLIPTTIREADPPTQADMVLCSHVFYHIERGRWLENVKRMACWLAPGGVLAVAIQNHASDCMRMVRHFTADSPDLPALARTFAADEAGRYDVRVDTVPAQIRTDTFPSACVIAEFIMNAVPLPNPPPRAELERYVEHHFRRPEKGYQFSCDQDFLRIQRKA